MAKDPTFDQDAEIKRLLGIKTKASGSTAGSLELLNAVNKGLGFGAFSFLAASIVAPVSMLAAALGIAERTLARRKESQRFSPEESDRISRIARILVHASRVFDSQEKAAQWLKTPNRALSDQVPLALLSTDVGTRMVEEMLNRIEFGIYS